MATWMKVLLILLIILISFVACRELILEHIRLKKVIEGRMLRKRNGKFDRETYITGKQYYKDRNWLSQKNKGVHPCKLKRPINVRRYSDGCNYIVVKKGM